MALIGVMLFFVYIHRKGRNVFLFVFYFREERMPTQNLFSKIFHPEFEKYKC